MRESAKARKLRLWKIRQTAEGHDVSDVHTLEDAEKFFDELKKKSNQKEAPKTTDEGTNEEPEGKKLTTEETTAPGNEETNEGTHEPTEEITGKGTSESPTDETTGNANGEQPGNGETDGTTKTNSGDGLEDMNYQDLKKMAKEFGLSQDGKKVELIERIRQHKEE